MKITRFPALAAALMMLCVALTGCSGENTAAEKSAGGDAAEPNAADAAPIEVAAHIRDAIAAADLLTNRMAAIMPGEGIVATENAGDDYLPRYSIYDLRKLSFSASGSTVLALTKNGELYYKNQKLAEGVADVVYATTNMNEEGWYVTADGDIYCVYDSDGKINTYQVHEGASPVSAIAVEKHDVFVACDDGFISTTGNSEHWAGCAGYADWGRGIAVIDASKVMNTDDRGVVDYATVAAITADGRTLAVGDYAEDILAWGELSYITMNDGAIVGLKTDGTLCVTGPYAQTLTDAGVCDIANVAGVKVSGESLSIVDKNGVYYFFDLELYRGYCSAAQVVTVNGAQNDDTYARIYTDTYTYYSYGAGDTWTDDYDNVRASGVTMTQPASTLAYPLTEESVEAYLDALFADRKAEMDADGYNWFDINLTDNGCIYGLQVTTEKFYGEMDAELFEYVARTLIQSELFGVTPAAMRAFDEIDPEDKGVMVRGDGYEMEHGGSPYGEVIRIIGY